MRVLQAEYEHSPLEFLQLLDLLNYLPGSVLAKADRSSMDWGLENRSPLLNTRLAIAGLCLKPKHLLHGDQQKAVLKQLLIENAGVPPKGPKHGFGAAIQHGSELEVYLRQRIDRNMYTIMSSNHGSKTNEWLGSFIKHTKKWNQNSLFCLSIWSDWQTKVTRDFPYIKVE